MFENFPDLKKFFLFEKFGLLSKESTGGQTQFIKRLLLRFECLNTDIPFPLPPSDKFLSPTLSFFLRGLNFLSNIWIAGFPLPQFDNLSYRDILHEEVSFDLKHKIRL